MPRTPTHRYEDPLDLIWLRAAETVGLRIARSDEVFAAYDGAGTLTLCSDAHFDADDSLAQMVFHELCHALVAGHDTDGVAPDKADWGMENVDDRDLRAEHACHRLQAALADRHGLRSLFAVTTDHRAYWDGLPADPLGPGDDDAIPIARGAMQRATHGPWAPALTQALEATRAIADIVRSSADGQSLWSRTQGVHRAGFPLPVPQPVESASTPVDTCGNCAWAYKASARSKLRCRRTKRPGETARAIRAELLACVRYEAKLDAESCDACGACCREAFDVVQVRPSELFVKRHPGMTQRDGFGLHVPRPGGRCLALAEPPGHRCSVYAERPQSCRDFAIAGDACLEARRRVGLS